MSRITKVPRRQRGITIQRESMCVVSLLRNTDGDK